MTEDLRERLEALRAEINRTDPDDPDSRARLNAIITDIEGWLERPQGADHQDRVTDEVRSGIERFETDHPRATAILNDILVALGNLGI